MCGLRTHSWLCAALFGVVIRGSAAGQDAGLAVHGTSLAQPSPSAPAHGAVAFDQFVDAAIRQERRLTDLLRYYKPIVHTYIQEEKPDPKLGASPKADRYFISRLDLTGNAPANLPFEQQESFKQRVEKDLAQSTQPFAAVGFAQAVFPDLHHFDRQNYTFEFVR